MEEVTKKSIEYFVSLSNKYQAFCIGHEVLTNLILNFASEELTSCNIDEHFYERLIVFNKQFAPSEDYRSILQSSLIQKNLFLVETYYDRISLSSLSRIL